MGRIRTIKPDFPQSESMGRVSREARLLFIQLWTISDDSGKTRASSRMLASLLYPYDDDAPTLIEGWLAELSAERCIVQYEIDGSHYLQINNWLIHQKIDKPTKSKIPDFVEPSRILANPRESSATEVEVEVEVEVERDMERDKEKNLDAAPRKKRSAASQKDSPEVEARSKVWNAYALAYQTKYGIAPVRNGKGNSLIKQLTQRIGLEDASQVAAWYPSHRAQWYVSKGHSLECLVADAEKLRTEWATGREITHREARQIDEGGGLNAQVERLTTWAKEQAWAKNQLS